MAVRAEGQPYRFEFTLPENVTLSPPEMERLHMQASVAMMQASGNQLLQIDRGAVRPPVSHRGAARERGRRPAPCGISTEAQVVIDASDYHIVEFAVKGTFLKQPYSVSYRLISRTSSIGAAVEPGVFEVPEDPRRDHD